LSFDLLDVQLELLLLSEWKNRIIFYRIFTYHIRAVVVSVVDPAVQSGALAVVDVVGAVIGIATPI
jgi:uncharacterized membrane protein